MREKSATARGRGRRETEYWGSSGRFPAREGVKAPKCHPQKWRREGANRRSEAEASRAASMALNQIDGREAARSRCVSPRSPSRRTAPPAARTDAGVGLPAASLQSASGVVSSDDAGREEGAGFASESRRERGQAWAAEGREGQVRSLAGTRRAGVANTGKGRLEYRRTKIKQGNI